MDKVRRLRGVSFDWTESGSRDIGMIAEEVGRVIPEIVDYEANGTDAKALARQDCLEQRLGAIEQLIESQNAPRLHVPAQP